MGHGTAQGQQANIIPPEGSKILAIVLDATSREKDLGNVDLGGQAVRLGGDFFLTLVASVDSYVKFSATSGDAAVNEATEDAAATSAVTFNVAHGMLLPANRPMRFRINRTRHRYMYIKGSAAGRLRGYASSDLVGAKI